MDDKEQILEEILEVDSFNNLDDNVNWLFNITNNYRPYPLIASKTNKIINRMRSKHPFGFISAFRNKDDEDNYNPRKLNMDNNRKLAFDLRSNHLSYINILGEWDETLIDKNNDIYKKHVKEISFFVIGLDYNVSNKEDIDRFRNIMVSLQLKYHQDSVIIGYIDTKGARPLKTTNIDMLNDPKNKDIDFSNDIYYIEFTNEEGKTDFVKYNYKIISKEDIEKLKIQQFEIDNTNEGKSIDSVYHGHTKIDNKSFIFSKCFEYHPNSMMATAGYRYQKYVNAIGLYF
jgi:hypothetical protein